MRFKSVTSDSGQSWRRLARPLIGLTIAGLVSLALTTPANSAAQASATGELVDSLVVKYEPGASIRDTSGDPNGADLVKSNVELSLGENLGLGYHTINFDQPIPVEEAKKIASQLDDSSAVAIAEPNYAFTVEDLAPNATVTQNLNGAGIWGLDRIDQENLNLDSKYIFSSSGSGVTAYIVDSGIRSTHTEFISAGVSRVTTGYSAVDGESATTDCVGHGTHVSGIVGGNVYGVSKAVTIVPVKVLDCSGKGTTSELIAGINWIINNHPAGQPAVANFSLGSDSRTGSISSVDSAITNLINDGVQPVVASGNSNDDACYYSPANSRGTITVNASTTTDTLAYFSNFGACTDIVAPGWQINAAGNANDTDIATKSGTSMAAPFVTGVIANILSETPTLTPTQIWTTLSAEAINAIPADAYGSPTRFLHQPSNGWSASTKATSALQALAEQQAAEAARIAAEQAAAEAKAAAEAEAARIAAEQQAAFNLAKNTLTATASKRVISVRVTAPAGSSTAIQIETSAQQRVPYQKAYKVREKYTVVNSLGKTVTKYRYVTRYRTAYRTVTVKVWKTVNSSATTSSYSWKAKKAGIYKVELVTPFGTTSTNKFRVR